MAIADIETGQATTEEQPGQPGQADGAQGQEAQAKTTKPRNGVYVQTPAQLRERLEAEAAAVGKTPAVYVRDLLATQWGVELPPAPTRTVYSSPDEKKAAQKQKRQSRNELIKQLLAQHKAALEAQQAGASANGQVQNEDGTPA